MKSVITNAQLACNEALVGVQLTVNSIAYDAG